jgi:hypothetical protein
VYRGANKDTPVPLSEPYPGSGGDRTHHNHTQPIAKSKAGKLIDAVVDMVQIDKLLCPRVSESQHKPTLPPAQQHQSSFSGIPRAMVQGSLSAS